MKNTQLLGIILTIFLILGLPKGISAQEWGPDHKLDCKTVLYFSPLNESHTEREHRITLTNNEKIEFPPVRISVSESMKIKYLGEFIEGDLTIVLPASKSQTFSLIDSFESIIKRENAGASLMWIRNDQSTWGKLDPYCKWTLTDTIMSLRKYRFLRTLNVKELNPQPNFLYDDGEKINYVWKGKDVPLSTSIGVIYDYKYPLRTLGIGFVGMLFAISLEMVVTAIFGERIEKEWKKIKKSVLKNDTRIQQIVGTGTSNL